MMKQLLNSEVKNVIIWASFLIITVPSRAGPVLERTLETPCGIATSGTSNVDTDLKGLETYARELNQLAKDTKKAHGDENLRTPEIRRKLDNDLVFINQSQMDTLDIQHTSRENLSVVLERQYMLLQTNAAYLDQVYNLVNDDSIFKMRTKTLKNKVLSMICKVNVITDIPKVEYSPLFLSLTNPTSPSFRSGLLYAGYRVFGDCVKISEMLVRAYTKLQN